MGIKNKTVEVQVKVCTCDKCGRESKDATVPGNWWHLINEETKRSDHWQGPSDVLVCDWCYTAMMQA